MADRPEPFSVVRDRLGELRREVVGRGFFGPLGTDLYRLLTRRGRTPTGRGRWL